MAHTRKRLPGVVERYEGGMVLSELATFYGVSKTTVWRHLKESGVTLRPRGETAARLRARKAGAPTGAPMATGSGEGRTT